MYQIHENYNTTQQYTGHTEGLLASAEWEIGDVESI